VATQPHFFFKKKNQHLIRKKKKKNLLSNRLTPTPVKIKHIFCQNLVF
jgi:hypothetical protein